MVKSEIRKSTSIKNQWMNPYNRESGSFVGKTSGTNFKLKDFPSKSILQFFISCDTEDESTKIEVEYKTTLK